MKKGRIWEQKITGALAKYADFDYKYHMDEF